MKKMISAATAVLLMASCGGSDDDTSSNDEASIVGFYIMTELNVFSEPLDFNNDGVTSTNILVEAPCIDNSVTFSSDGTYISNADAFDIFDSQDDDGNWFTTVNCFGPYEELGSYSVVENVLTITTSNGIEYENDIGITSSTFTLRNDTLKVSNFTSFGEVEVVYQRQ